MRRGETRLLGVVLALLLVSGGCGGDAGGGGDGGVPDGAVADRAADTGGGDGPGQHDGPGQADGPGQSDGPGQTDGPLQQDAQADVQQDAGPTYVTIAVDGDIAEDGKTSRAREVAALISGHSPAVVGVLLGGDNARWDGISGTLLNYYQTYYAPATEANWGQFDAIAYPQLGNHEYANVIGNAQGYFDYFATRMTAIKALPSYHGFVDTVGKGYYSVDINGWHVVSINSNCGKAGGCQAGSAQEAWLKADLTQHAGVPTIATWHAPRYACGGSHGDDTAMQAMWADLYDAHADFVFSGHNHYYQRWKPLDKTSPDAVVDDTAGLTEIIVGSGGVSTYTTCSDGSDSRVAAQAGGDNGIGVLFLTLGSDGSYSFEYRLRNGTLFDSGSGVSHNAP